VCMIQDAPSLTGWVVGVTLGRISGSLPLVLNLLAICLCVGGVIELVDLYGSIVNPDLQPAACEVVALAPVEHRVRLSNKCHPAHHGEGWQPHKGDVTASCGYYALTPAWLVDVTMLSRYHEVTHDGAVEDTTAWDDISGDLLEHLEVVPLRRHALHEAHTRPWRATAVPPKHSVAGRAGLAHGAIAEGACCGQTWIGLNATRTLCLSEQMIDEWLPPLAVGSTYPCHASRYGDVSVFMDADIRPQMLGLSVIVAFVGFLAAMIACCCACALHRSKKKAQAATGGDGHPPGRYTPDSPAGGYSAHDRTWQLSEHSGVLGLSHGSSLYADDYEYSFDDPYDEHAVFRVPSNGKLDGMADAADAANARRDAPAGAVGNSLGQSGRSRSASGLATLLSPRAMIRSTTAGVRSRLGRAKSVEDAAAPAASGLATNDPSSSPSPMRGQRRSASLPLASPLLIANGPGASGSTANTDGEAAYGLEDEYVSDEEKEPREDADLTRLKTRRQSQVYFPGI